MSEKRLTIDCRELGICPFSLLGQYICFSHHIILLFVKLNQNYYKYWDGNAVLVALTSLLKLVVEECCDTLLLYLEDHVEAVDGEDEVDGEGEEENHEERLEDGQGGGAGHLHL